MTTDTKLDLRAMITPIYGIPSMSPEDLTKLDTWYNQKYLHALYQIVDFLNTILGFPAAHENYDDVVRKDGLYNWSGMKYFWSTVVDFLCPCELAPVRYRRWLAHLTDIVDQEDAVYLPYVARFLRDYSMWFWDHLKMTVSQLGVRRFGMYFAPEAPEYSKNQWEREAARLDGLLMQMK